MLHQFPSASNSYDLAAVDPRPIGFDPNCVGCIHNAERLSSARVVRCIDCFTYDGGFCGDIYPFCEMAGERIATLDGEHVCAADAAILRGPEWRDAA